MQLHRIKKSLFHIFWKSDLNLIVFGGGYVFIFFFLIQRTFHLLESASYDIEGVVRWMDVFCYIHFPLMFLASINFFTMESMSSFDEVLDKKSIVCRDRTKAKLLLWMNGVICSFFVIVQVIYLMQSPIFSVHYLVNSIFHVIYVWGGVGVLAIELGMVLAKIHNKNLRLILFLIFNFLLGYPFLWLNSKILLWWDKSSDIAPIKNFFMEILNVLPDGLMTTSDGYGCHAIEMHKWFLLLSWILFCGICNSFFYHFYKRKIYVVFMSVCTLLCIVFSSMPYGKIDGTGQRTYNKYFIKYENASDIQHKDTMLQAADFNVTAYSMEFYVGINLYAKVTAVLSEPKLNTYNFTLLDGYRVLSVRNQDNIKMNFKQDGNYLCVFSDMEEVQSLTFEYLGASAPLYSDFNGIYLPAGVPFFPMAGERAIFVVDDESGNIYYNENHLPNTEFNVKVHTLSEVYSSLNNTGVRNNFFGTCDGFFLLAGTVFSREKDNVTFYYPNTTYAYVSEAEFVEVQQQFIQDMNELLVDYDYSSLNGKKVLVMWMTTYNDGLEVFDDFVGVDSMQITTHSKELYQKLLGDKE